MVDAERPFVFLIDDDEAIRASVRIALEAHRPRYAVQWAILASLSFAGAAAA